jgi:hypothetical protein
MDARTPRAFLEQSPAATRRTGRLATAVAIAVCTLPLSPFGGGIVWAEDDDLLARSPLTEGEPTITRVASGQPAVHPRTPPPDPALESPRPWTRSLARLFPDRPDPWRSLAPPSIRDPGPDTNNFPNSPFTLPRGGIYVETSPVYYETAARDLSPPTYNWEYLVRLGLTDSFEFRLYGNGLTFPLTDPSFPAVTTPVGFAPVVVDTKMHLWDEDPDGWMPATGLEVYIQTEFASDFLQQGTQPGVVMLFSKDLPFGWTFGWNIGCVTQVQPGGSFRYTAAVQWAFSRAITADTDIFLQGFHGQAALPRGISDSGIGGGFTRYVGRRMSLFGAWNAGLNDRGPATILYSGLAVAL